MSIRIITDSTVDADASYTNKFSVVPLTVSFGEKDYSDGVDLSKQDFYRMLETGDVLPKTSQAPPDTFARIYRELRDKGDEVIQEIHVYNNGTDVMQPNLMHLPPYLTAQVVPETISPGHGATITVTLHSEKLRDYGLTQTNVYLGKHLGDKVNADIEVPVSAILLPDLSAFANVNKEQAPQLQMSTTDIDFTSFDNKSKKTVDVTLQNTGHSTLVISSLQMFTSGLKVTLGSREINPGQSTTLKITGIASDLKNVRKRPRILMITNDPDHSKVVINIKLK